MLLLILRVPIVAHRVLSDMLVLSDGMSRLVVVMLLGHLLLLWIVWIGKLVALLVWRRILNLSWMHELIRRYESGMRVCILLGYHEVVHVPLWCKT